MTRFLHADKTGGVLTHQAVARALDAGLHWQSAEIADDRWADLSPSDFQELRGMLKVAHALELTAPDVAPSPVFRAAARHRMLAEIARPPGALRTRRRGAAHFSLAMWLRSWYLRAATGLAALSFAGLATAQASASALPGDPLYVVKWAGESLALVRADGDQARAEVLLNQAGRRLDETARLGELGRTTEALTAARRYGEAVDGAVAALESAAGQRDVTTPSGLAAQHAQAALLAQLGRAVDLITRAPEPSRASLEEVFDDATLGLGRVAALGADRPSPEPRIVAPEPTVGPAPTPFATASVKAVEMRAPGTSAEPDRLPPVVPVRTADVPDAPPPVLPVTTPGEPDAAPPVLPVSRGQQPGQSTRQVRPALPPEASGQATAPIDAAVDEEVGSASLDEPASEGTPGESNSTAPGQSVDHGHTVNTTPLGQSPENTPPGQAPDDTPPGQSAPAALAGQPTGGTAPGLSADRAPATQSAAPGQAPASTAPGQSADHAATGQAVSSAAPGQAGHATTPAGGSPNNAAPGSVAPGRPSGTGAPAKGQSTTPPPGQSTTGRPPGQSANTTPATRPQNPANQNPTTTNAAPNDAATQNAPATKGPPTKP